MEYHSYRKTKLLASVLFGNEDLHIFYPLADGVVVVEHHSKNKKESKEQEEPGSDCTCFEVHRTDCRKVRLGGKVDYHTTYKELVEDLVVLGVLVAVTNHQHHLVTPPFLNK